MPEVENEPNNRVKNRSPQDHFEGQDTAPLRRNHILLCKDVAPGKLEKNTVLLLR